MKTAQQLSSKVLEKIAVSPETDGLASNEELDRLVNEMGHRVGKDVGITGAEYGTLAGIPLGLLVHTLLHGRFRSLPAAVVGGGALGAGVGGGAGYLYGRHKGQQTGRWLFKGEKPPEYIPLAVRQMVEDSKTAADVRGAAQQLSSKVLEKIAFYPFTSDKNFSGTPEEWREYQTQRVKHMVPLLALLQGGFYSGLGAGTAALLNKKPAVGALIGGGAGLLGGGALGAALGSYELKHTSPKDWEEGLKIFQRKHQNEKTSAEVRGAALAASPEGQQIIFNFLKQAADRRYKRALDENPEVAQATQQRKDDLHNQELQFGQDKHKFELQKLQLQVEQQQMNNEAKKQKLMQSGMMPPAPSSPAQQQGQYLSNLMSSQQPQQ